MTLQEAFNTILNTRGLMVSLGMERQRVGNFKARIKAGKWPDEKTMRKWLLLAGWTYKPEEWNEPNLSK